MRHNVLDHMTWPLHDLYSPWDSFFNDDFFDGPLGAIGNGEDRPDCERRSSLSDQNRLASGESPTQTEQREEALPTEHDRDEEDQEKQDVRAANTVTEGDYVWQRFITPFGQVFWARVLKHDDKPQDEKDTTAGEDNMELGGQGHRHQQPRCQHREPRETNTKPETHRDSEPVYHRDQTQGQRRSHHNHHTGTADNHASAHSGRQTKDNGHVYMDVRNQARQSDHRRDANTRKSFARDDMNDRLDDAPNSRFRSSHQYRERHEDEPQRRTDTRGQNQAHQNPHRGTQSHLPKKQAPPSRTIVRMALPEYDVEKIKVKVKDQSIVVSGRQICGCEDSCALREFERVHDLPYDIDVTSLAAEVKPGKVLNIYGTPAASHRNNVERSIDIAGAELYPTAQKSQDCRNKRSGMTLGKLDQRTGETYTADRVPRRDYVLRRPLVDPEDDVTIEVDDEYMFA